MEWTQERVDRMGSIDRRQARASRIYGCRKWVRDPHTEAGKFDKVRVKD